MKKTNKSLIVKTLALAVNTALLATFATTAHANKKPIGDLEIYKAPEGGKVTIMMMLDTSGSMVADQVDSSACDFPNGENFVTIKTEKSNTVPSYDRTICTATGFKQYGYAELRPANGRASVWYNCNNPGGATCTSLAGPVGIPSLTGYTAELASRSISIGGATGSYYRYYKVARPLAAPLVNADRLTRLKDALFKLLDKDEKGNYLLDSNKVAIGIGQFSTQSGANNVTGVPDGTTGKILVPARPLTEAQRDELKVVAAQLIGGGGTPSAAAYAEAGAYMLGTTTNATSNKILREKYRVVVGRDASRTYYACTAHSPSSGVWCSAAGWTLLARRPTEWDDNKTQRCRNTSDTCFSEEISDTTVNKGLSGFANSATSTKNGNNYISPIETASSSASCDGQGIYFLTDGEPNSSQQPELMMAAALGNKASSFVYDPRRTDNAGALPAGLQVFHGTPQVGLFAKSLRESDKNPKNVSIRTAVVGFGSVFDISKYAGAERTLNTPELNEQSSLPIAGKFKEGSTTKYIDCSKILAVDARNACNWGAKSHPELAGVGGFGEGGFYSAQSTNDVINSVTTFLGDLSTEIASAPSGVITVPDDPYSVSAQQAVAYLPMMEAKVAGTDFNAVWPGNLKKYQLRAGTVWGQNGQRLFRDTTGALNDNVQDEWSTSTAGNGNMTTGGFYAQLVAPTSGTQNVRTLYIEDFTTATNQTPIIRKFGVNANGKITLDDNPLSTSVNFNDRTTYTAERVKFLLHFLGFTNFKATANATVSQDIDTITNATVLANIVLERPTTGIRVLGASPHSAPTALSYNARLDSTGSVSTEEDARDDYVIFGSMDGALHMANAQSGAERFAFIPKKMLTDDGADGQIQALKNEGKITTAAQPKFGVDAPWLVSATYDYADLDDNGTPNRMQATEDIYAYGGLRMGGDGLYALNLGTNNTTAPTLAFVHTPSSRGFARLGQVWTRPTKAKILNNGTPTDVLIFGGGYDMCYENENFQVGVAGETYAIANDQRGVACTTKTGANSTAIGNALYMVNATTGELIWSASNTADATAPTTARNATNENIRHSIVGGVNTIDRNGDGYADAIYFSDLGGQIFRADAGSHEDGVPNRVVRLLAPTDAGTKYVRRFYDRPVLSVYQQGDFNGGRRFVLVNAITGDRSNPTSKMREFDSTSRAEAHADRVYGVIDTDIGARNSDFYGSSANLVVRDVSDAELVSLVGITGSDDEAITTVKNARIADVKSRRGWYYPLTYFDGYTNVRYSKGMGKSEVIGSLLFSSIYNPDKNYGSANSCSASVIGGSEYQMYCLPWGVCTNVDSRNGHGGFLPAGQGISELTLGPTDNTPAGRNRRVLISSVAFSDSAATTGRIGFNAGVAGSTLANAQGLTEGVDSAGGSGSMPEVFFDQRFVLQPLRWYDNSIKNN